MAATDPPATIGALRVEGVLGEGGMGRVYLCHDDALARAVAVKTLLPSLLGDAVMRERFAREARAMAKVQSPHVVVVHAVSEDAGVGPFVVMERLIGADLLAVMSQRSLTLDELLAVGRAGARGLGAAHAHGLLHRDIKPANLFVKGDGEAITSDNIVITDFGLAKELSASAPPCAPGSVAALPAAQLTATDIVVGTPAYLAPELARGQPASVASDLYALGATLFHAWCNRPPFLGDQPLEVLTAAVLEPAPRARALRPDTPPALDDLLAALLEKQASARPATADDVTRLLDGVATAELARSASQRVDGAAASATQLMGSIGEPATGAFAADDDAARTSAQGSGAKGAPVKTATYTVMMTDIAGYTERTGRQSRDEAARWLALHNSLLQPIFRGFAGKVVKTIGDAFLVVFSSPTDAVHCGMAVQDRLSQHNAAAPADDQMHVRIALSAGEVRVRGMIGMGGDIFGEPVNLAARLEALAEAGEVLLSDAVFATMNQAEVRTAPRGSHAFKGISRPVAVYAVVPTGTQLPFDGITLARVGTSPLDAVRGGLGPVVRGSALRVRSAVDGVIAGARGLGPRARWVALATLALVLAVVVLAPALGRGRRSRIRSGGAQAVAAELATVKPDDRSARDHVDHGLALLALNRRVAAFEAFAAAIGLGSSDNDMLDAAWQAITVKDDAGAVALLAAWPSPAVEPQLRERLKDGEGWWPRHHALAALEARKAATDDDRQTVGLIDVTADDCASRRYGLGLLRRAGSGKRALAAVRELGKNLPGNLCLGLDLRPAEEAIKRRRRG